MASGSQEGNIRLNVYEADGSNARLYIYSPTTPMKHVFETWAKDVEVSLFSYKFHDEEDFEIKEDLILRDVKQFRQGRVDIISTKSTPAVTFEDCWTNVNVVFNDVEPHDQCEVLQAAICEAINQYLLEEEEKRLYRKKQMAENEKIKLVTLYDELRGGTDKCELCRRALVADYAEQYSLKDAECVEEEETLVYLQETEVSGIIDNFGRYPLHGMMSDILDLSEPSEGPCHFLLDIPRTISISRGNVVHEVIIRPQSTSATISPNELVLDGCDPIPPEKLFASLDLPEGVTLLINPITIVIILPTEEFIIKKLPQIATILDLRRLAIAATKEDVQLVYKSRCLSDDDEMLCDAGISSGSCVRAERIIEAVVIEEETKEAVADRQLLDDTIQYMTTINENTKRIAENQNKNLLEIISQLRSENLSLKEESEAMKVQLEEYRKSLASMETVNEQLREENEVTKFQLEEHKKSLATLQTDSEQLGEENEVLKFQLEERRRSLVSMETVNKRIRAENEDMKAALFDRKEDQLEFAQPLPDDSFRQIQANQYVNVGAAGIAVQNPVQPKKQKLLAKLKLSSRSARVKCVDLHPMEPLMLAALYSGHVQVWNFETQQLVYWFICSEKPVRTAKFIVRMNWIVSGDDEGKVRFHDCSTVDLVREFDAHQDYIRAILIHPTEPFILTAADDNSIRLWNWNRTNNHFDTAFQEHSHYVMCLAINPKNTNVFASGSLDKTVKVWNLNLECFTLRGHQKGVTSVAFYCGSDRSLLISGSDDCTARIWDYQSRTCLQTLTGHTKGLTCVAFHPEFPLVITGSEDWTLKLWNDQTWRLDSTLDYGMQRVWAIGCVEGSHMVGLGYDEGCRVIKLRIENSTSSVYGAPKPVTTSWTTFDD